MSEILRLCCGQSHAGPVCPDGKVMCCLCFDRFEIEELANSSDVCQPCAAQEAEQLRQRPCQVWTRGGKPCGKTARFRGVYRETFSADHGRIAYFCGVHANVKAASDGWNFTEFTPAGDPQ